MWRRIGSTLARVRQTRCAGALLLGLLLSGCAALPDYHGRVPSVALADVSGTGLEAAARRSIGPDVNGFRLLIDPEASLQFRLALIERAERTLDLQYFVWNPDTTGRLLLDALQRAATRGVRVRLLLDDLHSAAVDPHLAELSRHGHAEVRMFNPFPWGRHSLATRVVGSLFDFDRVRHRMHNKLFVADNVYAITGGRNIGDEYLQAVSGDFLDVDLLVAGPLVRELSHSFDDYWNSDWAYPAEVLRGSSSSERAPTESAQDRGSTSLLTALDEGRVGLQACGASRLFADPVEKASGVHLEDSSGTLHDRLIHLFGMAHREIVVVSPYFVRGEEGSKRIQALIDRGVRLRLLTNSLATTDEHLAHAVYLRYRRSLIQHGVDLREYAGRPVDNASGGVSRPSASRLHAKLAVVDQRYLYVGSLNFTSRSQRLNTELGLVLDCPALALEAVRLFDAAPAYRVRARQRDRMLEWVRREETEDLVLLHEPGATWWNRIKLMLLAPFVPESEI